MPNQWVKIVVLTIAISWLSGCGINNIPSYDEAVKAGWSEVQNQYKRRSDLIPNLIETVKGFAAQEKEVLTEVIEARANASQVEVSTDTLNNAEAFQAFQANQDALSGALSRLMLVVERYPELKSNENFLTLQSQLEGTENRIAVARRDYIKAVQTYNTELRTIPGRWWRALVYPAAKPAETFSVPEEETQNPQVKFN